MAGLCVFPSQDQSEDYLALFDSSSDGRKKLASLSKASPDRTTWNILVFTINHTPTFIYLHIALDLICVIYGHFINYAVAKRHSQYQKWRTDLPKAFSSVQNVEGYNF